MGGSSLAPDVLHRTFGSTEGYLGAAHPRLDRPGLRVGARSTTSTRSRTLVIIATKSGTTTEPNAFLADAWDARREGARRGRAPHATSSPGAFFAAITDPGRASRRIAHSRRVPRGLPQPARHRRALLGADLRRARAGVAHRARPRRAAGVGRRDARRLPRAGPGGQPGRLAGPRPRRRSRKAGRDKLTFLADDEIAQLRRVGRAAHRREHRQARRRDRAGRPRAARRRRRRTGRIARSSGSSLAGVRRRRHATRWPTPSRRPAIRSSGSSSPTRSTSAPSSSAGRSRPRSPAPSSGIDPFDQPNVEEAKQLTRDLLERMARRDGARPTTAAADADRQRRRPDPVRRRGAPAHRGRRRRRRRAGPPPRPAPARRATSASRRSSPRRRRATRRSPGSGRCCATGRGRATTAGYGPRFLHSTGQLHKGGAPIGWFLQLTADHPADLADPGLAVHLRPAHRRPGRRRLRAPSSRTTCRSCASTSAPTPTPGWPPSNARSPPPSHARRRADRDAPRLHRSRPDGRQHGPPAHPRRPRGRRLQPDAGEDQGDRRRGRDAVVLDRGARRRRWRSRARSGSWSRPATRPRPRSPSCSSTSSRATRSSTAATRTSTTTSGATPSSRRRASTTSTPGRRAGSGASRSATA